MDGAWTPRRRLENNGCTTAKHANCEGEEIAKGNNDFLTLVTWYYGALHQYRDKFDLKIKVEGPNWSF